MQVLLSGLELEGLCLRQSCIRFFLQPLRFQASRRCTGGLLQGPGITGYLEIGYVVRGAGRWEVKPERTASGLGDRKSTRLNSSHTR